MKKILLLCLLAFVSVVYAAEPAAKDARKESLEPFLGPISQINKTAIPGLYEVVTAERIFYTDEAGQYLIFGSLFDTKTGVNQTESRSRTLFAIDFDKLPLDIALKKVKGNGKRKMAYFSDPNCGYCRKLEKELSKVNDVTLYLFLYPIFQGSDDLVRNVRCAKDPVKAWDDLMLKGDAPAKANCNTPTEKVVALARKHRVNGTPNLIFADGMQNPGYMPAEELEKRLNEAAKK